MKKATIFAAALVVAGFQGQSFADDSYRATAKAGECFSELITPATFETVTEQVVKVEASKRIKVIPEKWETRTEKVLVKDAGFRLVTQPATYKTVSERVLAKPAYSKWEMKDGVSCKVEVPASYKTTTKKVLATPAQVKKIPTEAKYQTVTKQVLVQEAKTVEEEIPAQYDTITHQKVVKEQTVSYQKVLCKRNMTASNVMALQKALKAKGYYTGSIDGAIGPGTFRAASNFAKAKGFSYGSTIVSMDVATALGLKV